MMMIQLKTIGASIGFFFTCASALMTMKREGDGSVLLKCLSTVGTVFSLAFVILQLVPIPGLNGVHFGKESYIMLILWIVIGVLFYGMQRKKIK